MSLIHELKASENSIQHSYAFYPVFMNIIYKRGYFIMSAETFDDYSKECLRHFRGKETFKDWLYKKGLKVKPAFSNHIKITK